MASVNQMGEGSLPSVTDLFSLKGKTAICTGGTGGLGLSMAIALAEAGADIVSIQIKDDPRASMLAEAVKECGRELKVFEADVADSPSLRACFAKIWDAGVVPDILLNCAGINRRAKVEDFTDENIDAVSIIFNLDQVYIYIYGQAMHDMSIVLNNMDKNRFSQSISKLPLWRHRSLARNCLSLSVPARSSTLLPSSHSLEISI